MDSRSKLKEKLNHFLLWKHTDQKKPTQSLWSLPEEKAERPMGKAASKAAENAKDAAEFAKPMVTGLGLALLTETSGFISILAPLGIPLMIGGIVVDAIKAPFCLAVATEEGVRAGITKLTSLVFENSPTDMQIERIFKSFLIRLKETATILVLLGLEDADVLDKKLKSGDIEDLVGLTLLHSAYASRHYDHGLVLATNKTLTRTNCPTEGLMLFDKIVEVKNCIRSALAKANSDTTYSLDPEKREIEESRIVCQWIREIYAGKLLSAEDKPEASPEERAIVNTLITQIEDLKKCGMATLPKPAEYVANQVPSFRR